jgi:hypothetical protein
MTFLEIVNKILIRLRETEVNSINQTPYSKLIAELVNVTKREVEDAWGWSHLRTSVIVPTTTSIYSYELTGINTRSRIIDVINNTSDSELRYQTTKWFNNVFLTGNTNPSSPTYYNLNGVSSDGDHYIDLFPIPDGEYDIRVNAIVPQADLVEDGDVLLVPYQIVVEGALARAISERGDDGGYTEQEGLYRRIASDYIALDAANRPDETIWYPT